MSLNVHEIKGFLPQPKPCKRYDSGGLYLLVKPNGSKLWQFKYRFDGIEKKMPFGAFPEISLGLSPKSARSSLFYYYEQKMTAIRMGPWKFLFSTKEDYYATLVPRTAPLVFNIRVDPSESYDNKDSCGHVIQRVSRLLGPMKALVGEHLKSLAQFPPVQGGKSFDMSNMVSDFLNRSND